MKLPLFARRALGRLAMPLRKRFSWRAEQNIVQAGLEQHLTSRPQGGADTGDQTEQDILLRKAMADLRPDERAALIRKVAGFSHEEIAEWYGKAADAVAAQIEGARQTVRKFMHKGP